MEESARQVTEVNSQKSKLQQEKGELLRQLEDAESQISAFGKLKQFLAINIFGYQSSLGIKESPTMLTVKWNFVIGN